MKIKGAIFDMKNSQNLSIKIAVQWFESLTTLENTYWHLFSFNLFFWIKKPRTLVGSGFF